MTPALVRDRYSITQRLTVLVVAVGLVSAALTVALSQMWHRNGTGAAEQVREHLGKARAEMQQAAPAQRAAVAGRWRANGLQITRLGMMARPPAPPGGPIDPRADPRLGPGSAAAPNPELQAPPMPPGPASGDRADRQPRPAPPMGGGPGLRADLQAVWQFDDEMWGVELVAPAAGPWQAWLPTLGALALLVAGSMLASAVAVRWITRPITQLAHALYQQRQHLRPITPSGPVSVELHEIIVAFNSLVQALQAAEDTRRHMLAGLSHDLRTPLARLRLRTEIELGDEVGDKMAADFDALRRIIDQFIVYTQSEAALDWQEPEMLDDLVTLTVDRYDAGQVRVASMDPAASTVELPALPIDRALGNLIDNALDHGTAPVEVEVQVRDGECSICVYDHGRGLPAGMLPTALQPFVRLRSDTDGSGHCGLGLAIVAQVARQFGGRVVHETYDGRRSGLGLVFPLPSREHPGGRTLAAIG